MYDAASRYAQFFSGALATATQSPNNSSSLDEQASMIMRLMGNDWSSWLNSGSVGAVADAANGAVEETKSLPEGIYVFMDDGSLHFINEDEILMVHDETKDRLIPMQQLEWIAGALDTVWLRVYDEPAPDEEFVRRYGNLAEAYHLYRDDPDWVMEVAQEAAPASS